MIADIIVHISANLEKHLADALQVRLHDTAAVKTEVTKTMNGGDLLVDALQVHHHLLAILFIRVEVELSTTLLLYLDCIHLCLSSQEDRLKNQWDDLSHLRLQDLGDLREVVHSCFFKLKLRISLLDALESELSEALKGITREVARAAGKSQVSGAHERLSLDLLVLNRCAAVDGGKESLKQCLLHGHDLVLGCDNDG